MKGAIFDLDGTLLDSNDLWDKVDKIFLARHGLSTDPEYEYAVCHLDYAGSAAFVVDHYQLPLTPQEVMMEWESLSWEAYQRDLPLKTGARQVIKSLHQAGLKMALVTLSPPVLYEAAFFRLGIGDLFSIKYSLSGETHSKKSAALYHEICHQMSADPNEVMGFEDNLVALKAMRESGVSAYALKDKRNINCAEDYEDEGFSLHTWTEIAGIINKIF